MTGSKTTAAVTELVIKSASLGDSGGAGEFQTMTGRKRTGRRSRGAKETGISESDKNDNKEKEKKFLHK